METLIEEVKKINEITILNLSVVSKNKREINVQKYFMNL